MADAVDHDALSGYTIRGGQPDKARLDVQAEMLRATTEELFSRAGLASGHACLDIGCGTGHTAKLMAQVVGPQGRVTGVDADAEIVDLARRDAIEQGFTNIEFQVCDLFSFDGGGYDFAHCRMVLSHLSDPGAAIARIASFVRPGGVVALEDIDVSGAFTVPSDDLFQQFVALYESVVKLSGGDALLAQRLPLLAADAGLRAVAWRYHQPVIEDGPAKQLPAALITNMRAAITAHGLADDATLDAMISRTRTVAETPKTLVGLPRFAQVWGVRD